MIKKYHNIELDLEWSIDVDMANLTGVSVGGEDITDLMSEKILQELEETYSCEAYQDWLEREGDRAHDQYE